MDNFEQFKKDFKQDVLIKIVISLKHSKISKPRSREIARQILEIFREDQPTRVFGQINKLAETQPDVLDIFIKRMWEYDAREKDKKIEQIQIYLKTGGGETIN